MKKKILFFALAITMLLSSALPYYWKELFVDKTGNIGHMDLLTVLLLLAGVRLKWIHIKEIIIGLYSFYLVSISVVFILMKEPNRVGFYLLIIDLLLIIIFTTILRRLESNIERTSAN